MRFSARELHAIAPAPSADAATIAPDVHVLCVFTPAEAAAIVATATASDAWLPAGINANLDVDAGVRDAAVLYEPLHQPHAQLIRARLDVVVGPLAQRVAPAGTLEEVQIVRYGVGGRYVDHRDSPDLAATPRRLSVVCYLDEAADGGETIFPELPLAVAPASGIAIAFPPTVLHRADPVARGTKHVVTAWYHAKTS